MTTKVAGYIGKINSGDGKEQALGSTAYGYCETAAATAAKVVDMTGFTLFEGATIFVKFKERNSASNPTLNVNGTGAKPIYRYATTRTGTTDDTNGWRAGAILAFTYDGAGWMHHYWQNTQYNLANNSLGGGNFTANSAIYRYQLLFHMTREKLTPLNNDNNITATTKTILTSVDFDLFEKIYYYNSTTTVAANASVGASALYFTMSSIDLRYTFNCGDSSLTAHKDVYLKVSKQSSGLFRLASATPTTQTLPSSADGYYYCLLGRATSAYAMALYEDHPIYYYDGELKVLLNHNHDERYYTESEVDTKLNEKVNTADLGALAEKDQAAWDTDISGKPSTFPPSLHTHNYAGSSSAGGAATSLANFENNKSSGKNADNIATNAHTYYTSNGPATSIGASTNDGALYVQAYSDKWVAQIAQDYRNGNLFSRGKNNGTWQAWKAVSYSGHNHDDRYYTESEVDTKLSARDILYFSSQAVSVATSAQIMRIPASGTNSAITADTVVLECTFADKRNIQSDITWTSYAGYISFTGTCVAATTANVTLGTKSN